MDKYAFWHFELMPYFHLCFYLAMAGMLFYTAYFFRPKKFVLFYATTCFLNVLTVANRIALEKLSSSLSIDAKKIMFGVMFGTEYFAILSFFFGTFYLLIFLRRQNVEDLEVNQRLLNNKGG
jgi:hypothetical protein